MIMKKNIGVRSSIGDQILSAFEYKWNQELDVKTEKKLFRLDDLETKF